jgi:hypothetical protein
MPSRVGGWVDGVGVICDSEGDLVMDCASAWGMRRSTGQWNVGSDEEEIERE